MIKQKLIEELGKEKAEQLLSEWGRKASARVKNRHKFTSESAGKAARVRWHENKTR